MYGSIIKKSGKLNVCALTLALAILNTGCDSGGQGETNNSATPVRVVDNATANIKFTENTVQATTGSDVTLNVAMQNLPATEGGGITLNYDSSMISVLEIRVNQGSWSFSNKNGIIDNVAGKVSDILFSNYTAMQGDAEIATITIHTNKPGKSEIRLTGSSVNPFASNGEQLDVSFGKVDIVAASN